MISINRTQNFKITIKGNNDNKNTTTKVRIRGYQIRTSYSSSDVNKPDKKTQPLTTNVKPEKPAPAKPNPYYKPPVNNQKPLIIPDVVEIKMKDEHIVIPGVTDVPKKTTVKKSTPIYGSIYGYYGIYTASPNQKQNTASDSVTTNMPKSTYKRKKQTKKSDYYVYSSNKPISTVEEKKTEIAKETKKTAEKIGTEAKKSGNKCMIAFGICTAVLGSYFGYKYFENKKASSTQL